MRLVFLVYLFWALCRGVITIKLILKILVYWFKSHSMPTVNKVNLNKWSLQQFLMDHCALLFVSYPFSSPHTIQENSIKVYIRSNLSKYLQDIPFHSLYLSTYKIPCSYYLWDLVSSPFSFHCRSHIRTCALTMASIFVIQV